MMGLGFCVSRRWFVGLSIHRGVAAWMVLLGCVGHVCYPQDFNVLDFDPQSAGAWSTAERTILTVPQVLNGSIVLDGMPSDSEYGDFVGVPVIPGDNANPAWILDSPNSRSWDGPADSSMTFWLAHDEDYLYIGAQVKDDVVNVDNDHEAFWKDDSIAIIIDALNHRYDIDAGTPGAGPGGQTYVTFDGQVSAWDAEANASNNGGPNLFPDKDWEFGDEQDVYSVGGEVEGGWALELRLRKSLMEDDVAGNKLVEGYVMGFNIGVDDDDRRGSEGANGSGELPNDLEIQYWWANRERFLNWNEGESLFYLEAEIQNSLDAIREGRDDLGELGSFLDTAIDSAGRLRGGAAGEIIFAGLPISANPLDCNNDGSLNTGDLACVTPSILDAMLAELNLFPGDFNGDGTVDFSDFLKLSLNFGKSNVGYLEGDGNLNGSVDFPDFLQLSLNFGKSRSLAAALPEPHGGTLLAVCLLPLLWFQRRRRAAVQVSRR